MKNLSKFIFIALIAMFIMPACKKYVDGPAISFRSKKARLVNQWKIDKVIAQGVDITSDFTTDKPDYVAEFKENGDYSESYQETPDSTTVLSGQWEFTSDKKGVNLIFGAVSYTSTILKLKNDELWLKTSLGTSVWEYHYITK